MLSKLLLSYGGHTPWWVGFLHRLTGDSSRLQDSHPSQGGGPEWVRCREEEISHWSWGKREPSRDALASHLQNLICQCPWCRKSRGLSSFLISLFWSSGFAPAPAGTSYPEAGRAPSGFRHSLGSSSLSTLTLELQDGSKVRVSSEPSSFNCSFV